MAYDAESDVTREARRKELLRRLYLAEGDRQQRQGFINEVYRLGMPHRPKVGTIITSKPISEEQIADVLDSTMAEAIDDFASDMIAMFTPPHEDWVDFAPTQLLNKDQQRLARQQIHDAVRWFWDDVTESSYYDAADECFHDLAAGTMAVMIRDDGPTQPIIYEPVPIRNLLIDGCYGPDMRCQDGMVEKRRVEQVYGGFIKWPDISSEKTKFQLAKPEHKFRVRDGVHKIYETGRSISWRRFVMIGDELVYENTYTDGLESLVVARWRTETETAYGVGAAWIACAPQRVLNELHALTLAQMHNVVDPAHAYYDPLGTANLEQGVGAGDWISMGDGFEIVPIHGDGEFQAAFYKTEDLRMLVKRALYQDKPEQRGDTPPSATQWTDESARAQQRFEIPRGKVIREWVLPIVRGHQARRTRHGRFPPIKIGSDAIMLQPQSPQTKARTFERIARSERVLGIASAPPLQQASVAVIDAAATLRNVKEQLQDDVVVIRSDEEIAQMAAQAAALAGGGGGDSLDGQQAPDAAPAV